MSDDDQDEPDRPLDPLPETPEAAARGCTCALATWPDGSPVRDINDKQLYRISKNCPVHDRLAAPDIFFDDDHYRGYRAVLVRLPVVAPDELDSLLRRACAFHAARPKAQALTVVALTYGGQALAVRGVDDGADGLCHAHRLAQTSPVVNPTFGSKH